MIKLDTCEVALTSCYKRMIAEALKVNTMINIYHKNFPKKILARFAQIGIVDEVHARTAFLLLSDHVVTVRRIKWFSPEYQLKDNDTYAPYIRLFVVTFLILVALEDFWSHKKWSSYICMRK